MYDDPTQVSFPLHGKVEIPMLFEPQVLRCHATGAGGRPITILLDTGTDPSAIDLQLARRLGLPLGEFALGRGAATDSIPYTETTLPWLQIGDLTLRDLFVLALDLKGFPFQVDLVLGYNVLCQVVLTIDYVRRQIGISHPDLGIPEPSPSGAVLPLHFFEHYPALSNVVIGDTIKLPLVTLDTGSNGGLTLGPDLAQQLGLCDDTAGVVRAKGTGFGGCHEILRGAAKSLLLGPYTFHNIDLDTPGKGKGELTQYGRANMGNRVLARFANITLDYGRKLCRLEPRQSTMSKGMADIFPSS